jgi:archaeosortase A (PGF-CTERM-specific)
MLDGLLGIMAWAGQWSDPLAWLVVATFAAGSILEMRDRDVGRPVTIAAWVLFAVFWATLIHHFAFVQKSIIEGLGTVIAVPGALYVAWHLHNGRDSLVVLSRSIAVMGLLVLPVETLPIVRQTLIETVTRQTEWLMTMLGYDPTVVSGATVPGEDYEPYRSTFRFVQPDGHEVTYTILLACTGIGSMAIFAGLIAAVRAPLTQKLQALAVSIPIIYGLNLVRNVFIGLSFGKQYMHVAPELVMSLFATDDPYTVSYYVADRIIAQSLSVVVLVGITFLVVRYLPQISVIIEDVLFLVTGSEYDLQTALGQQEVRADGDGGS